MKPFPKDTMEDFPPLPPDDVRGTKGLAAVITYLIELKTHQNIVAAKSGKKPLKNKHDKFNPVSSLFQTIR